MRAGKLLSSQGITSRSKAKAMIAQHGLRIPGDKRRPRLLGPSSVVDIKPGTEFGVGNRRYCYRPVVYLILHKPRGFECSHAPQHHPSVFELLPPLLRARASTVKCAGRLDVDTSGLLLFSDHGAFIHHVEATGLSKTYKARMARPVTAGECQTLREGVHIHDRKGGGDAAVEVVAHAACVDDSDAHTCTLQISEGKYHQVRRMFAAIGHRVEELERTNIGDLTLPASLTSGQWAFLSAADAEQLSFPRGHCASTQPNECFDT